MVVTSKREEEKEIKI